MVGFRGAGSDGAPRPRIQSSGVAETRRIPSSSLGVEPQRTRGTPRLGASLRPRAARVSVTPPTQARLSAVYRVQLLDAATRDLERLEKLTARRVVARLRWLATNFDSVSPEALTGDLSGLYKLRVGDHRVVYEAVRSEETLIVHRIGHRRDIYRGR